MRLYSKQNIADTIIAMKNSGRLAHAILITGEKGTGKKVAARYIACMILCEKGNACGECRHCRRIENNTHPDVICPERSGKKRIYSKDTIRGVCSDAFIYPNDCDSKIYILSDCENFEEPAQNLMLKLIEEPPDNVYFIFTAEERSAFLPTILSRVITLGVSDCSPEDCEIALENMGIYDSTNIKKAVLRFHGNIGNCINYLEGGETTDLVSLCISIIDCIIGADEYAIIAALAGIGENRDKIRGVLLFIDKVIRDACILRIISSNEKSALISCYPEGAKKLSDRLSFRRARIIHEAICKTMEYCSGNVNVSVAVSALGGVLVG